MLKHEHTSNEQQAAAQNHAALDNPEAARLETALAGPGRIARHLAARVSGISLGAVAVAVPFVATAVNSAWAAPVEFIRASLGLLALRLSFDGWSPSAVICSEAIWAFDGLEAPESLPALLTAYPQHPLCPFPVRLAMARAIVRLAERCGDEHRAVLESARPAWERILRHAHPLADERLILALEALGDRLGWPSPARPNARAVYREPVGAARRAAQLLRRLAATPLWNRSAAERALLALDGSEVAAQAMGSGASHARWALNRLEDRRAVGVLLDACTVASHRFVGDGGRQSLARLLPRLQPGDIDLITSRRWQALWMLTKGHDLALISAARQALCWLALAPGQEAEARLALFPVACSLVAQTPWYAAPPAAAAAYLERLQEPALLPRLLELYASRKTQRSVATRRLLAMAIIHHCRAASPADAETLRAAVKPLSAALQAATRARDGALIVELLALATRFSVAGLRREAERLACLRGERMAAVAGAAQQYMGAAANMARPGTMETGRVDSAPVPVPADELERAKELLRRIGSLNRQASAAAEQAFFAMGPAATEALLQAIRADAAHWRRRNQVLTMLVGLVGLGELITFVAMCLADQPKAWFATWGPMLMIGIAVGAIVLLPLVGVFLQSDKARLLSRLDDPRVVGVLLDALSLDNPGLRKAALGHLTALLPRMRPSDGAGLTPDQRARLRQLAMGRDVSGVLAILKALQQVGTEEEIPLVSALAAGQYPAGRDGNVREAAAACEMALRVRLDADHPGRTLLRASTQDAGDPAVLVRPAGPSSSGEERNLVRPVPERGGGNDGREAGGERR